VLGYLHNILICFTTGDGADISSLARSRNDSYEYWSKDIVKTSHTWVHLQHRNVVIQCDRSWERQREHRFGLQVSKR
jgi:hypothetical protein